MTTRHDPISSFRSLQHRLAESIALERLVPLCEAAEGLVGRPANPNVDPEAAALLLRSELRRAVCVALELYTDWVASHVVRAGTFVPVKLTMPPDADVELIAQEADVPAPIVRFVIDQAGRQTHLPILGDVVDGTLSPNSTTISQWASHFDWEEEK